MGYSQNCWFESSKNFYKNVFSRVFSKNAPCTTYNYIEKGIHRKGFQCVIQGFLKLLEAPVVQSLFSKVTEEISAFYNSAENSVT